MPGSENEDFVLMAKVKVALIAKRLWKTIWRELKYINNTFIGHIFLQK